MWTCSKCKATLEDPFDSCWFCGTKRDGTPPAHPPPADPPPINPPPTPTTDEPGSTPATPTNGCGSAFVKGGCGCLVLFAIIGVLAVLAGAQVHVDVGGLILLFIIGGLIGLVVLFIYNQGRKDAGTMTHTKSRRMRMKTRNELVIGWLNKLAKRDVIGGHHESLIGVVYRRAFRFLDWAERQLCPTMN